MGGVIWFERWGAGSGDGGVTWVSEDGDTTPIHEAAQNGRLRYYNLGVVALVMLEPDSERRRAYKATYWSWPVELNALPDKVVDVGIWGRFPTLEATMVDYDVNFEDS